MVQTRAHKQAFLTLHRTDSMFPFRSHPLLVSHLCRTLRDSPQYALLGGNRGVLAPVLGISDRTINIEITDISPSFIPTRVHDLETAFPRSLLCLRSDQLAVDVVSAFALEYTDVPLVAGHLAAAMRPKERLLWCAHHAASEYVSSLQKMGRYGGWLEQVRTNISSPTRSNINDAIRSLQTELSREFSTYPLGSFDLANTDFVSISDTRLAAIQPCILDADREDIRTVLYTILVSLARLKRFSEESESVTRFLLNFIRLCKSQAVMSKALQPVATTDDMVARIGSRFECIQHDVYSEGSAPIAVVGLFSRLP